MKIGLFADPHYAQREKSGERRFNRLSKQKITECYGVFAREGCSMAICLGDLIDNEPTHEQEISDLEEIAAVIHASGVPTVCVMGNHDAFAFTAEEYYSVLGGCEPKDMQFPGSALIFLDACYYRDGTRYAPRGGDWRNTFLPDTEGLKAALGRARGSVYVFLHQNLDPGATAEHRLSNADEVIDILEKSGKVKAVCQGHYHPGSHTVKNGIEYVSLRAMCEYDGAYEIIDI